MDIFNNNEAHILDLPKISSHEKFAAITRLTALQLMAQPYLSVGSFFKSLSNNDLTLLLAMVDDVQYNLSVNEYSFPNLLALTEMLTRGEGTEKYEIEGIKNNVNILCLMINLVSLERKGLIDLEYDNLSFGDDMNTATLAKIREGVDADKFLNPDKP